MIGISSKEFIYVCVYLRIRVRMHNMHMSRPSGLSVHENYLDFDISIRISCHFLRNFLPH